MSIYIALYVFLAFLALLNLRGIAKEVFKVIIFIILVFIIGFRYKVGGDWYSYLQHYEMLYNLSFFSIFKYNFDIGHAILNWIMGQFDTGVYGVNFIYAIIFCIGLFFFSFKQPYPFLALTVAFPYLILVVAMGYSRQSAAIGLFMIALVFLQKRKFWQYIFFVLLAALFHKTALILLIFVFILPKETVPLWLRIILVGLILYGAFNLLATQYEHLINIYIGRKKQSSGALIRIMLNILPSVIFLFYIKKFKEIYPNEYKIWFWISISSILMIFLLPLSSTVADRLSLYFIPLQLFVYANLPYLFRYYVAFAVKIFIIILYLVILLVWLNFASHAYEWIPYQNIVFKFL